VTCYARRPAAAGERETPNGVPTRVEVRSEAFSDAGSIPAASTFGFAELSRFRLALPKLCPTTTGPSKSRSCTVSRATAGASSASRALALGYGIAEIGVEWKDERRPRINPLEDMWKVIGELSARTSSAASTTTR
jgi:hypothetical protein